MNSLIVKIIGAAILLSIVGALVLSALSKTPPDWTGRVADIGIGALAGLVVGGTAVVKKEDSDA